MPFNVLLVDDHKLVRDGVKTILERGSEFKVVGEAEDGANAVQMCRKSAPDIVLMDIGLPGMNGIDVLKKIRKDNEKIPVFIITAFSNEERFKLANKFNASGFIVKTNDLQREIQNITAAIAISEGFKGR